MMERSRDRPATGGLRKAVRCLIPPDPELTTVKNGGKAPATLQLPATVTVRAPSTATVGNGHFSRRPAILGGRKAAGNESAAARIPGALFRQLGEWTEPSPATRDVCRKDDVDGYVDTTGGDVAAEVGDMDADMAAEVGDMAAEVGDMEHNADISPSRADIIAAARADIIAAPRADIIAASRADIIAASRADIIAAARADIIADTGASRADVSNYTIKARADIIDDTRKARADINTDTCKNRADVSNSVERNQAMHDAPHPTGLYVGNIPLHAYPDTIIDDKIAACI
ncbi:UNVERIFIED_CONTAM: hypothetical protein Sindi_0093900 [Sesamum indicum]